MNAELDLSRGITFKHSFACTEIHYERDDVVMFAVGRKP